MTLPPANRWKHRRSIRRMTAPLCQNRDCHAHRQLGCRSFTSGRRQGRVRRLEMFDRNTLRQMRILNMASVHFSGVKLCDGQGARHCGLHGVYTSLRFYFWNVSITNGHTDVRSIYRFGTDS
jgi:hypothetical protein